MTARFPSMTLLSTALELGCATTFMLSMLTIMCGCTMPSGPAREVSLTSIGVAYNVLAQDIAEAVVTGVPQAAFAECYLVSQIGKPVDAPALTHVSVETRDGSPTHLLESTIGDIVACQMRDIPNLVGRFVSGAIEVV